MNEAGPQFLKEKYQMHTAPEVEAAAKRKEIRTNEKVSQDPEARLQNYLDRLSEITGRPDEKERARGLEAAKRLLHHRFVIKPQEIPEAYFDNQRRIAREQGHGDVEIDQQTRDQLTEVIIADQESSLDKWVDYLSSEDATYPDWLKYWSIRSVLTMGEFDKEKHQFTKRSKGTTKPFPDLNREALAYVLDSLEKKYGPQSLELSQKIRQTSNELKKLKSLKRRGKEIDENRIAELEQDLAQGKQELQSITMPGGEHPTEDIDQFTKILNQEDFGKLYAFAIEKVTPESQESLANTKGEWVKYDQNSDHMPLVQSLQSHGTGWCTAGESTAQTQLQGGDFYVYYSQDQQGQNTIPRAAIRMAQGSIAEVRGIAPEQNLDPHISEVVEKKIAEFPDGEAYAKKAVDMKQLTEIDRKTKAGQELTKNDLTFLYEINDTIQGFGYQRDPRIAELLATRNPEADMPIVFECERSQIAHSVDEISTNTKAFVGPLEPGIFQKLPELAEHVYKEFPEGRIHRYEIEIGGKTKDELKAELKRRNIYIHDWANQLLESTDFTVSEEAKETRLIRLTVADLGFPGGATTDQIYEQAGQLGLELCPAETGPQFRLSYDGKEWILIAMKQITDRSGDPSSST